MEHQFLVEAFDRKALTKMLNLTVETAKLIPPSAYIFTIEIIDVKN